MKKLVMFALIFPLCFTAFGCSQDSAVNDAPVNKGNSGANDADADPDAGVATDDDVMSSGAGGGK